MTNTKYHIVNKENKCPNCGYYKLKYKESKYPNYKTKYKDLYYECENCDVLIIKKVI